MMSASWSSSMYYLDPAVIPIVSGERLSGRGESAVAVGITTGVVQPLRPGAGGVVLQQRIR